jgi:hypothetical protein
MRAELKTEAVSSSRNPATHMRTLCYSLEDHYRNAVALSFLLRNLEREQQTTAWPELQAKTASEEQERSGHRL